MTINSKWIKDLHAKTSKWIKDLSVPEDNSEIKGESKENTLQYEHSKYLLNRILSIGETGSKATHYHCFGVSLWFSIFYEIGCIYL